MREQGNPPRRRTEKQGIGARTNLVLQRTSLMDYKWMHETAPLFSVLLVRCPDLCFACLVSEWRRPVRRTHQGWEQNARLLRRWGFGRLLSGCRERQGGCGELLGHVVRPLPDRVAGTGKAGLGEVQVLAGFCLHRNRA